MKSKITDEQFKEAVSQSYCVKQLLSLLGLKEAGGNYKTVKDRMRKLRLSFGLTRPNQKKYGGLKQQPLDCLLVTNSTYQSYKLKNRLLKEGVLKHKCSNCHLTTWLDNPVPLELDHINGDNTDNRLENLRLLCPNCHALTNTYRGKNKGKYASLQSRSCKSH